MNYGITLPYNDADRPGELARIAEEAGWDGVFVGDAVWAVDPLMQLAAAAMVTRRIRLGTLVLAAPLHNPRQLANETLALDLLSNGRLTLGLGLGATWMGWQGFPDEDPDTRVRAEKLDETIELLTRFYLGKPFDFEGKHYRVTLTRVEEQYYPPKPVQQPRIPLWLAVPYPRKRSMERMLQCDGACLLKVDAQGQYVEATPEDARAVRDYAAAHRTLTTPFDLLMEGKTGGMSPTEQADKLGPWAEAGVTWWVESLWGLDSTQVAERLRQGPPRG